MSSYSRVNGSWINVQSITSYTIYSHYVSDYYIDAGRFYDPASPARGTHSCNDIYTMNVKVIAVLYFSLHFSIMSSTLFSLNVGKFQITSPILHPILKFICFFTSLQIALQLKFESFIFWLHYQSSSSADLPRFTFVAFFLVSSWPLKVREKEDAPSVNQLIVPLIKLYQQRRL